MNQKWNYRLVSSVAHSCPILCNPMHCSTPGFPVHHQLPEPAQTHVHQVGDAIQPSHPLLSPSPPAFNLSQHQGFFNESVLCNKRPKYWNYSLKVKIKCPLKATKKKKLISTLYSDFLIPPPTHSPPLFGVTSFLFLLIYLYKAMRTVGSY